MSAPEIWRVVDPLGGVREVPVRVEGGLLYVGAGPGPRVWPGSTMPRLADAAERVARAMPESATGRAAEELRAVMAAEWKAMEGGR